MVHSAKHRNATLLRCTAAEGTLARDYCTLDASFALGRYGDINEDFVLVDGWGECEAEGSQEIVEGVGKALV